MKKKIFGGMVVVAIAVCAMINVNLNKVSNKGDLALANVEALAQNNTEVNPGAADDTWQIGDKTINGEVKETSEKGWTWSFSLKVWLFEGKVSNGQPSTFTVTNGTSVKIKCCQPKGPEATCCYELC